MTTPEQIQSQPYGELLTNLLETELGGVRSILEEHGGLKVVGSYALGLLSQYTKEPDIDMNLLLPEGTDLVDAATDAGKRLIAPTLPWHKFEVYDNRKPKRPAMPRSVYLGIKAYTAEAKVAADVWFFDQPELFEQANINHDYVETALTAHPEYREYISVIKNSLAKSGVYVPSYTIYRAVIEQNVTSIEDFQSLPAELVKELGTYKAQNS